MSHTEPTDTPDLVPVEQLIGWTRNPEYDGWDNSRPWHDTTDAISNTRERAEVDDLLEWLDQRDRNGVGMCVDQIDRPLADGPYCVKLWVPTPESPGLAHGDHVEMIGDTLRDALVAAVREATQ